MSPLDTGVGAECQTCGAHVSKRFVRVFGTNSGEVYACQECANIRDLRHGAAHGGS
jgi:uncharacterized Zn finger protein